VSYSNVFKWTVIFLLSVSIAWKIAIPPDDENDLKDHLIEFLQRNRFEVTASERMVNYMPIIEANTASCQLTIARLFPNGSNRDLIQHLAENTDRLFIVFRGRVYAEQPIFLTVVNYFWSRFLRELGVIRHITPIIAVAAKSSCNAEALPWDELREIS
jgi:hypothetical protein